MNVFLNGHEVGSISGSAPLGEVLDRLRDELVPAGHVVTSLKLDDHELGGLDPVTTVVDADAAVTLVVRCDSPERLLVESRGEMASWTGLLLRALTKCAERVRRGEEWNGAYVACLDGLQTFVQYVHPAGPLLEQAGLGSAPSLRAVGEDLRGLEEAFVRRDDIGVADVLEYQLAPLVRDWHEYLSERS